MVRLIALLALAACGLPWTLPHEHPRGDRLSIDRARNGTYSIRSLDGEHHGVAFVVDRHHLVTVADLCRWSSALTLAPGHAVTVRAMDARWCLLEAVEDMGAGLVLTRDPVRIEAYPRMRAINGDLSIVFAHREQAHWVAPDADIGAPVIMHWGVHTGVAGIVLADGRISSKGLRWFLHQHQINWAIEVEVCEEVNCGFNDANGDGS